MKKVYLLYFMVLLAYGASGHEVGPLLLHNALTNEITPNHTLNGILLGVTGKVTDENGTPFPGANIVVKGTTTGTTTDVDGNYSIDVPDGNSILVFSFVGYASQEVPVGGRSVI